MAIRINKPSGTLKTNSKDNRVSDAAAFESLGKETSKIDVRVSYRIIDLFSQGLYNSPTKAIEELVSNSFDAGATKVHVIISPDLVPTDSTIVVIDNGSGMDEEGLRQHWLIGISNKRVIPARAGARKPIGKFGIGKLATYVLAGHLTHITKSGGKYFAATMDYHTIPAGENGGLYTEKTVVLPLRSLTEKQAKEAVSPWTQGDKPAFKNLLLFGSGAADSWTVAIMSDLKPMAREMQRGKLRWILATAMPLRDDFELFLDGDAVAASKTRGEKYGSWVLGKSIKGIPSPSPSDELQITEDKDESKKSVRRWGFTHPELGRISGYVELYKELLTSGKSSEIGHSHGFFVYVRDRLVNIDDPYFGIDSNTLRHGTFARFRMVAQIDRLDDELRSSRESVREGPLIEITRNILHGVFNFVRSEHQRIEAEEAPGVQTAKRLASTPGSLTRRPLIGLVSAAFSGKYQPKYTTVPRNLDSAAKAAFIASLEEDGDAPDGLVKQVLLVDNLSQEQGIAVFDAEHGLLQINLLHPFVAHFLDEYNHTARNVPLELIAMSEVLLEAHLYELGLDQRMVDDAMERRDEVLRTLSRTSGQRNALMIARDLLDAANNKTKLETELVAAFDSLGFSDAVKIAKKGTPDGYAEARLGGTEDGVPQSYKITLEAKSKEQAGTKVSAKTVGVSTIARQRKDFNADYAVVVGPDFPTTAGETSALSKEIADDREKNPGKGITLIRIEDMAKLVRLVPAKRIGLHRLRDLFKTCSLPEESGAWIKKLATEVMEQPPYRELLEAISAQMKELPDQAIEYSNVVTHIRHTTSLKPSKADVIELCKALSKMATGYVFARPNTVEITQQPSIILDAISSTIKQYPEDEQKQIAVSKK